MRKGEELKAPRYASAAATRDYITARGIIPNKGKTNLFLIIGWDENSKHIYILCYAYAIYRLTLITGIKVWVYAFFNLKTHAIYTKMFKLVFKVLSDAA